MRICTSYRQPQSVQIKAQEIRYPISLLDSVLERLETDYITDIIVEIYDYDANTDVAPEKIHDLATSFSNLFFDFFKFDDFKFFAGTYEERKYMYHFPVNTYMDVQYLLQYQGLAAITLEEPLTFDLPNVHKAIKWDEERNIQIRVYPAIGKPSRYRDYVGDNGINHFWILPQHLYLYEDYIDVIELTDKSERRERALVNMYSNQIPYLLSIDPLFPGVDSNMMGAFVDEDWVEKRIKCQQTCLQKGIHCGLCLRQDKFFQFCLEHPEDIDQLIKQKMPDINTPTNPDLQATD